jgi:hypothetical protein
MVIDDRLGEIPVADALSIGVFTIVIFGTGRRNFSEAARTMTYGFLVLIAMFSTEHTTPD